MNLYNKIIGVIGGDKRIVHLSMMLSKENIVQVYGLEDPEIKDIIYKGDLKNLIEESEIIITPIPFSKNEGYVNSPTVNYKIESKSIGDYINNESILIGCEIPTEVCNTLMSKKVLYYDLMKNNDFLIQNALPTAEGAIYKAMQNSEIILSNSDCIVLGYGRCAKILANKLQGFGANVTIAARKSQDLSYGNCYGYRTIDINNISKKILNYDFIFNTVPQLIINENVIKNIKKSAVIIDIASNPGGTDFNMCEKYGIRSYLCLGLPGKIAPKTAAEIIYKSIKF